VPTAVFTFAKTPTTGQALVWNGFAFEPGSLAQAATNLTGLTVNRVPFGNSGGGLQDSANLTFDGSTLTLTGAASISGVANFTNTTEATSSSAASAIFAGGIAVAKKAYVAGYTSIGTNTDPANAGERLTVCSSLAKASGSGPASVAYFCTNDTPGTNDLAFIFRLGTSATASARFTGLQSYEQGTGPRLLALQDLGGRVCVGGSSDDTVNALQVVGGIKGSGLIQSSSATGGVGYATGAGGTVTQATSKATGVTLNTVCGTITLNSASLAATTSVAFTLTNSAIAATDLVMIQHDSVGTLGAYSIVATPAGGSATITVRNNTAGALAEAIVLRYAVFKAVTA
jgi:hypothetical protein